VAGGDPLGPAVPLGAAVREGEGLASLDAALGHRFADHRLLEQAVTHASLPGGARSGDYERLEFLGDRVLGLVVADLLYAAYPQEDEGALAKRLAVLARKDTLARVATAAALGDHLVLSRAESQSGGRRNPTLLADACEAVIGALYLDGGLDAAAGFIRRYWQPAMTAELEPPQDAKTALQEWAQGAGLPLPVYRTVRTEGPPHEPLFAVEVAVQDQPAVTASGRTKRTAEQAAAAALLDRLRAARKS